MGFDPLYEERLMEDIDRFNFDIFRDDNDDFHYIVWHENDGVPEEFISMKSIFKNFVLIPKFYNEDTKELSIHFEKPLHPVAVFMTGIAYDILLEDGTCKDYEEIIDILEDQGILEEDE